MAESDEDLLEARIVTRDAAFESDEPFGDVSVVARDVAKTHESSYEQRRSSRPLAGC